MITPEEAADMTEAAWLARAQGESGPELCGWCQFIEAAPCEFCPVHKVFGCYCVDIPEILRWFGHYGRDAALEVYELAVKVRPDLIAAAYEILEERNVEMPLRGAE